MNKEETVFLRQLVKSLEEAEIKLEEAYKKKDLVKLNQTKKFMIDVQKKISEILK